MIMKMNGFDFIDMQGLPVIKTVSLAFISPTYKKDVSNKISNFFFNICSVCDAYYYIQVSVSA